jgi:hypothetical protein
VVSRQLFSLVNYSLDSCLKDICLFPTTVLVSDDEHDTLTDALCHRVVYGLVVVGALEVSGEPARGSAASTGGVTGLSAVLNLVAVVHDGSGTV